MDLATGVRQATTSSPEVPQAPSLAASEPPGLELQLAPTSARKEALGEVRQPITPTVQLSPTSSPNADFASVRRPIVQRRTDGATPVPPSIAGDLAPAMPLAQPSLPAVSIASVQRVTNSSPGLPAVSETSASGVAMAPLAGARPLRPTAVLQRSAPADGSVVMEDTPSDPDPPPSFPLLGMRNDAPRLEPSQQGRNELGLDTPPHGGNDFHSPHPALPRKRGREFENPQGTREVSTGRLPLAPSLGIAVQRASDGTRVSDPAPQEDRETLQAVWYENRAVASRPSEGESTPVIASPAAPTGPSQASESEMDELARKLYDRIRGRLKTELLVDRERAGFLTDLR